MSFVELWRPETLDADSLDRDVSGLARVLHACVHAGASVSFILPFTIDEASAFWRENVLPAAATGGRKVLVARGEDGEIVGTVQLHLAMPPNQRHRGEIAKLLVHPEFRRQGLARALMTAAEDHARIAGRTLITLDTRTGDAAEPLYLSMGYQLAGIIPRYARGPHSPELEDTSLLFKEIV